MRSVGSEVAGFVYEHAQSGQFAPKPDIAKAGKKSPPKVGPGPCGQPQYAVHYNIVALSNLCLR